MNEFISPNEAVYLSNKLYSTQMVSEDPMTLAKGRGLNGHGMHGSTFDIY